MQEVELSIIILNYNTKTLTLDAVSSVEKNYSREVASGRFEVIVVDNASRDGSVEAFKDYKNHTKIRSFHIVASEKNVGFAAGNNQGVALAKGKYILFLNPDTIVYPETLTVLIAFLKDHPEAGAVTCKLIGKDGKFDFNSHRGFPTPWNSFCYFSGLQKIFPKSRLFAGYTQGWKGSATTHEVDAISGAFIMLPRTVGEKINWWDEDYFFYGEDLQLCFDIRKLGLKIYFVSTVKSMHIGGAASGIKKKSQDVTTATLETKKKVQAARFDAMKIFYKKNYKKVYPQWLQQMIFLGIDVMHKRAVAKLK